ncbi:MAG: aminotransferase DegT [Alphaproteobacteria bacterium 40-19]|nr:MAG: aminotransferase DegT [Alphaproteobacteria bacterium 40-19]
MSSLKPLVRNIPFVDLESQQSLIRSSLECAIKRVLDHGAYAMGPEVFELEKALSEFCGAKHVISCSNGTDALAMGLRAYEVGPQDAIFVPAFTYVSTAEVVVWMGACPVFIDINPNTYNVDAQSLQQGIVQAKKMGLNPKGIITVDLFGQPADYDVLLPIAQTHGLWIMADGAQSFGATYKGSHVGTLTPITTTSFYPSKPLGGYGDGGAVFTHCDNLADALRSIRIHGQGKDKYHSQRIGMTGRLDTLQAAILLEKLKIFPQEILQRQHVAKLYSEVLKGHVHIPELLPECSSVWAQYTIQLPKQVNRSWLMEELKKLNIPTEIYYPLPLHRQPPYQSYPCAGELSHAEELSQSVLCLPIGSYLTDEEVLLIAYNIKELVTSAI